VKVIKCPVINRMLSERCDFKISVRTILLVFYIKVF
jgi:hypothetical protein